ncbi:MAG: hypothetical protein K9H25_01290 [Rhodospirillum sp.]|nr:hypothetical protein [Rhodospirillum sp.]MCF8488079.1 hypothetical protein [Rhodospirillum sp.]MCF8499875.1 hypothetical protein [Rhodospirillum sp.]
MPSILFAISNPDTFPYHESTVRALAQAGHQVHFLIMRAKSKGVIHKASALPDEPAFQDFRAFVERHPNLTIHGDRTFLKATRVPTDQEYSFRQRSIHALRNYASYAARLGPDNYYTERCRQTLPEPWRSRVTKAPWRWLVASGPFRRSLAARENALPAHPGLLAWVKNLNPDVIVASPCNRNYTMEKGFREAHLIRVARDLGIPSVVAVLSWDNLTTKGLIPFQPDLVLCWHDQHVAEAESIHGIPKGQALAVGSPFLDKWLDYRDRAEPPESLIASLGLNPAHPMLLYMGSSKNIATNESWLVLALRDALDAHPALKDTRILVRPHPANRTMVEDLTGRAGLIIQDSVIPGDRAAMDHLYRCIRGAYAVVGVNTSGMLDTVILDRPCLSPRTDTYSDTHLDAPHFQRMAETGAVDLTDNLDRLVESLARIKTVGADPNREARARFVARYIWPLGKSGGSASADAIVRLARPLPCDQGESPLIR